MGRRILLHPHPPHWPTTLDPPLCRERRRLTLPSLDRRLPDRDLLRRRPRHLLPHGRGRRRSRVGAVGPHRLGVPAGRLLLSHTSALHHGRPSAALGRPSAAPRPHLVRTSDRWSTSGTRRASRATATLRRRTRPWRACRRRALAGGQRWTRCRSRSTLSSTETARCVAAQRRAPSAAVSSSCTPDAP